MKKTVILFAVLLISTLAFAQLDDLIFSEYIEGSSNNKALEIYNGTGNEVDLSNYVILQNSNSGPIDEYLYWMEGMLANEDVYVFANDAADQAILDQADNLVTGVCWFNGDDYRGLGKIDPQGQYEIVGPDGETPVMISIIDMIGMFPDDPGAGWDVAGITEATANHTLVRKMEVMQGAVNNDEWLLAAGTNADDSEWIVFDSDTFDYIGVHEEIVIDPPNEIVPGSIVINEIMYNTPGYDNEWVELYNTTDQAINLEGAYLLDDDPAHPHLTIPEGYEIPAFGYFTILIDQLGDPLTFTPDYDGGSGLWSLGNGGDQVNFYDEANTMIDYTEYADGGDWPSSCDGDGPSLELISPELDNTLPASWQASWVDGGTPGAENSTAPTDPMITVLYPNGGEVFEIGGEYELTWESLNFTDNVDIYLNAPVRFDIALDVVNSGSYMWTVPTDAPLSAELMLVVEDAADGDPMDMSDDFFSIIDPSGTPVVVINEIMYNPSTELGYDDYYEFLELYNPGDEAVDMTGWYFTEGIEYTFADRFILEAGAYAVLAVNADSLFGAYGVTAVGEFSGALSNGGEDIILVTADGAEVDFVDYDDGGDWPSAPDGDGPSLELNDPELDNSLAANWHASYEMFGTPGAMNSMPTSSIGWGNLQWPYNTQIVVGDTTETIYGQVWMEGVTDMTGQGPGITAQLGYGADGSTPSDDWTWFDTEFNGDVGNNDEYMGMLYGMEEGMYDYTYRYIYEGDTMWYYPEEIGNLTVVAAPPEEVEITFAVDMQYQDVSENGVHIAGSFQGWDPAATEMFDDDQDMVYTITLTLLSGEYHEYKFVNGNAWGGDEDNNRNLTVPEEDTILPTVLFNDWFPVVDGLFFSEYIEGSSNNKALEIYNASGEEVSLDDFRIAQAVNGGGWEYYHYFPEGSMLAADDVWVIITDQTDPTLFDPVNADEVLGYPSVVHHNGDDARALEYTLDGENWVAVDIIGDPDEDPGSGWDVAGVATATQNHTLVRKGFVTVGNTDWTASAGTNADDSEWEVYDIDTFEYLGYHGEAPELEVIFNVNMNYQIELGNFNPDSNFVDIGANFNEWGAVPMVCEDLDMDGIYSYTTMLPLGYNCEFKFRIDGNWDLAEFPGGPNRTYVVVDGVNIFDCWFSDEEPPVVTTQDVSVTFNLNMEYIDPVSYAGGISIQGSVAPLTWDAGVNLLNPARDSYTIDILFPAGSNIEVEFKFAMLADGATEWVWESIGNRMFTIDDTQTTQILPEVYWDDFVLVTIPEIQTPVDSTDVSPYAEEVVTTQGIVTAITDSKYWISTPEGGAWNGLYVYDPDNMPALGDCIRITGTISEYYNLTEMFDITGYEVMSSGNPIPVPAVITTNQLNSEEQWESVLVMVENVTVTQEVNNYGEWYMDDGSGECQADDALYHVEPLIGDEYVSVTGIVGFSYGSFEMLPRFEEDLVTGPAWIYGDVTGDWNVDAFDAANMLQFAVQLDPIGAPLPWTWQLIAGDVDGNGSVEAYDAALVLQYSVDLIDVFPVEEGRISVPSAEIDVNLENGEIVFSSSGELYSAHISIDPASLNLGIPNVKEGVLNAVNTDAFAVALASPEVLEGELVRLPYSVLKDQDAISFTLIANGVSSRYDIESQELLSGQVPVQNALLGNYPNPFNPVTYIKLAVAENATSARVQIYNIKGQIVRDLFAGKLDSGYHSLEWNGLDNSGKPAGSGVYFYRVQIGTHSDMSKMLMLK